MKYFSIYLVHSIYYTLFIKMLSKGSRIKLRLGYLHQAVKQLL